MRRVLVVTAHPDDECMFFAPTIRRLVTSGAQVDLFCLSNGNADGKGSIREEELRRSCAILGIHNLDILNLPELQDGMKNEWNEDLIRKLVIERSKSISAIYTFDNTGVSGHPNHCAISRALSELKHTKVYKLRTFPLYLKYLGPICALILSLFWRQDCYLISVSEAIRSGRAAMYEHRSQMIWFRHLFVVTSIYMYVNVYHRPINKKAA